MKAEIRQQWLDKLRGGEVKQAQGTLRNYDNSMCCLGVLLDVAHPGMWSEKPVSYYGKSCYAHELATPDHGMLNSKTRIALGLDSGSFLNIDEAAHILVKMNDGGTSFAEIADWIEANIKVDEAT